MKVLAAGETKAARHGDEAHFAAELASCQPAIVETLPEGREFRQQCATRARVHHGLRQAEARHGVTQVGDRAREERRQAQGDIGRKACVEQRFVAEVFHLDIAQCLKPMAGKKNTAYLSR